MVPKTRQSTIAYKVTKKPTELKIIEEDKPILKSASVESISCTKSSIRKQLPVFESLDDEAKYVLSAFRSCDPTALPGREKQIDELEAHLRACSDHKESVSVYMYGSYGLGKTASLKILLSKPYVKKNFIPVYINCKRLNTSAKRVYEGIISAMLPKSKTNSKMMNVTRIKKLIDKQKKPSLLILDEVDELFSKTSVVLSLFELRARVISGKLVLIGVGNKQDLIEKLPPLNDNESLRPSLIEFEAYTKDEIKNIISNRLNSAHFQRLIFSEVALNLLAAKLASSGSARDALGCASAVVRYAVNNNVGDDICKIEPSAVIAVLNSGNTAEMVNNLARDDKVILCAAAILKTQMSTTGNLKYKSVFELSKTIFKEKVIERISQDNFYDHCERIMMAGLFDLIRKEKNRRSLDEDKIILRCHEDEIILSLQSQTLFSGIIAKYINS